MVELFPQNERGLSLDVFLSEEENPFSLSFNFKMTVPRDGTAKKYQLQAGANPRVITRLVQRSLNEMNFPEPVREVFFHNSESRAGEKYVSLSRTLYAEVLNHIKQAQTDPESRYRITFGQDRIPVVTGR